MGAMETQAVDALQDEKTDPDHGWLTSRRCFLLISLLATVCFANGLTGAFVQDDFIVVVNNPAIRSLSEAPRLFLLPYWGAGTEFYASYRPMTTLSHALVHSVAGLWPTAHHLANLLLHILNGWLVYRLVVRYLGDRRVALLTALLFIAHPVRVEVVSQVHGRTELLQATFFFGAWILFLDSNTNPVRRLSSWFLYAAALLSKDNAVVFVGVVALAEFCAGRLKPADVRGWGRQLGPFVVVTVLCIWLRVAVNGRLAIDPEATYFRTAPLATRLFTMVGGILYYFKLLIAPIHLQGEYDGSTIPTVARPGLMTVAGMILLAGIIGLGFFWTRTRPLLGFAILYFFVSISVVANILTPTGILIAERALYLPAIGFFLLFAWWVVRFAERDRRRLVTAGGMIVLIFAGMIWRDWVRNRDWADNCTFFRGLVRDAPANPKSWLGFAHCADVPDGRERALRKAVELAPDRSPTHLALGQFLSSQGRHEEAMAEFRKGYAIYARNEKICLALATGMLEEGNEKSAFDWFSKACEVSPRKADTMVSFAGELTARGRHDKALNLYREVLPLDPENIAIYEGIGLTCLHLNLFTAAEQALREGVRRNAESESLHANLGIALLVQEKTEEARKEFILALRLNPQSESALHNLRMLERRRFGVNERISQTRFLD